MPRGTLQTARFLKQILVLLLALAWVPVTAHCQLESVPGLEFLRCLSNLAHTESTEGHCGDAECCAVERSVYKTEQQRVTAPSPKLFSFSLLSLLTLESPLPEELYPVTRPVAPRDFIEPSWQFVSRAALPARAPSIAS